MSIILKTNGYFLTLDPLPSLKDSVSGIVYFRGTISLKSRIDVKHDTLQTYASFPLTDLEDLCEYISAHIHNLHPEEESPLWLPLDLTMQIRCYGGELDQDGDKPDGEFSILILLNIGTNPVTDSRVYGGFQSTVDIQEAMTFCAAIRHFVISHR